MRHLKSMYHKIEKVEDEIYVKVAHPMEKGTLYRMDCTSKVIIKVYIKLYPEEGPAEARFKYIPKSTIYAYCNKHGLWKKDVE